MAKKILNPFGVTEAFHKVMGSKIGKIVQSAPQMLGPYGDILMNAARRGTHALATTHFVLSQQDRHYNKMVEELDKEPEEREREEREEFADESY